MKELIPENLAKTNSEFIKVRAQLDKEWVELKALRDAEKSNTRADRDVMRQAPEGWKLVPVEPNLDQYHAACKAYCDWQVKCQEEAREHKDEFDNAWEYSQPNFTHSDVYRAMLAAAPTPPAEQQGEKEPKPAFSKDHLQGQAYAIATLRAKVEALPLAWAGNLQANKRVYLDDVLAEIDKLGGKV